MEEKIPTSRRGGFGGKSPKISGVPQTEEAETGLSYSVTSEIETTGAVNGPQSITERLRGGGSKASMPMPDRLYDMLQSEESESMIVYLADGDGFTIIDQDRFVNELLPKYFRHNNFRSFTRQLNYYGFNSKFNPKSQAVEYEHEFFLRGRRDLLKRIVRRTIPMAPEERRRPGPRRKRLEMNANSVGANADEGRAATLGKRDRSGGEEEKRAAAALLSHFAISAKANATENGASNKKAISRTSTSKSSEDSSKSPRLDVDTGALFRQMNIAPDIVSVTKKTANLEAPSYHGAAEVHQAVRSIIASIPDGTELPMSARMMVRILEGEMGLSAAMSNRLFSQIRKGATLHQEWKGAFAAGKFKNAPTSYQKATLEDSSATSREPESYEMQEVSHELPSPSAGKAKTTLFHNISEVPAIPQRSPNPSLALCSDSDISSGDEFSRPPCQEENEVTSFSYPQEVSDSTKATCLSYLNLEDKRKAEQAIPTDPVQPFGVEMEWGNSYDSGDLGGLPNTKVLTAEEEIAFLRNALIQVQRERDVYKDDVMRLSAEMVQMMASYEARMAALYAQLELTNDSIRQEGLRLETKRTTSTTRALLGDRRCVL
mmetsp:Transcript_27003/g.60392  ORF Transcript_27003/g.60392 Transcript_27003/m.60392 type:complete len:602 (+) Transcript_27003:41-1846(+)